MTQSNLPFDVVIIGAGVVGSAIARELAEYQLRCALVEAGPDVGVGISKANTAILHTGFDAKAGTIESRLLITFCEPTEWVSPRVMAWDHLSPHPSGIVFCVKKACQSASLEVQHAVSNPLSLSAFQSVYASADSLAHCGEAIRFTNPAYYSF